MHVIFPKRGCFFEWFRVAGRVAPASVTASVTLAHTSPLN